MRNRRPLCFASLAFLALATIAPAQMSREDAKTQLDARRAEIKLLEARANSVAKKIGELTSSGKISESDEALSLLRRMVDELGEIRSSVKRAREGIEALQRWVEGAKVQLPKLQNDVADLKTTTISGYLQFQYVDRDRVVPNSLLGNVPYDAFRLRRARLNVRHRFDDKASIRLSADFATGTGQTQVALRDFYVDYNLVSGGKTMVRLGQQNVPMGFEIERSSAEREFPERALYNQTYFNTERSRGVLLRHALDKRSSVEVGIWDSLTIGDPELVSLPPGESNRLAATARYRYNDGRLQLGVSGLAGRRPTFSTTSASSPSTDRHFLYLDGAFQIDPKWTLRAEAAFGHDRVPSGDPSATRIGHEVRGFQTQLDYRLNPRNTLSYRWEQLDPDRSSGGNLVNGHGLAFNHYFTPYARLQIAHERFWDETRATNPTVDNERRYYVTTVRVQFRF